MQTSRILVNYLLKYNKTSHLFTQLKVDQDKGAMTNSWVRSYQIYDVCV